MVSWWQGRDGEGWQAWTHYRQWQVKEERSLPRPLSCSCAHPVLLLFLWGPPPTPIPSPPSASVLQSSSYLLSCLLKVLVNEQLIDRYKVILRSFVYEKEIIKLCKKWRPSVSLLTGKFSYIMWTGWWVNHMADWISRIRRYWQDDRATDGLVGWRDWSVIIHYLGGYIDGHLIVFVRLTNSERCNLNDWLRLPDNTVLGQSSLRPFSHLLY